MSENSLSEYQQDCEEYYRLLRPIHTGVYAGEKHRSEELHKSRYTDTSHPSIRNLNTFIEILHRLCGDGPAIQGIDFGCGSHWFVDLVRTSFGWSAVGYDADKIAIELAQQRFPDNAGAYRCRNLLRDGLPEEDDSQTFVFCNAVLQHFDDAEVLVALKEMSRILKPAGFCMLVFKRWIPELLTNEDPLADSLRVLDAEEGKVLFQDPTMSREIANLPASLQDNLDEDRRAGWRLLHLFSVERIAETAFDAGLSLFEDLPLESGEQIHGTLTFRSGKGMPTVCMVLAKAQFDVR